MREVSHNIDRSVVEDIERFPMPELIRRLFPGHVVRERGSMPSPLRQDRHHSFSCYRGHGGVWLGKDLAENVTYNNISLYRAAFGGTFENAVNALSGMLFGLSAVRSDRPRRRLPVRPRDPEPEPEPALRVTATGLLSSGAVPAAERAYWRSRGISDENISSCCLWVEYVNTNAVGKPLLDAVTKLPVVDRRGEPMADDGRRAAVGLYNDIGGFSLRNSGTSGCQPFKGCTTSFFSFILADGSRASVPVVLQGKGSCMVSNPAVGSDGSIWINPQQRFVGMRPGRFWPNMLDFVRTFNGRQMSLGEVRRACAVLSAMSAPLGGRVRVVEGMYDGLSCRELSAMAGRGFAPGYDLLVLNGVGNAAWAAPVLACEAQVDLLLDRDLRSNAGQKASVDLTRRIAGIHARLGAEFSGICPARVTDASGIFRGFKDLNEALVADKGLKAAQRKGRGKGGTPSQRK